MARGRYKKYTAEFREEAVKLVQQGEKSLNETAQDLGISATTLLNWVKKTEGKVEAVEIKTKESMEEENQRLKRENNRLRMEREILKKATAFFAKENG